jgi:predicted transcriptional regulator
MNTNVLNQLIEQLEECLTAEAAQKIVSMEAKDDLQCRVDSLASTANAGKLTQDEQTSRRADEQTSSPNTIESWLRSTL